MKNLKQKYCPVNRCPYKQNIKNSAVFIDRSYAHFEETATALKLFDVDSRRKGRPNLLSKVLNNGSTHCIFNYQQEQKFLKNCAADLRLGAVGGSGSINRNTRKNIYFK